MSTTIQPSTTRTAYAARTDASTGETVSMLGLIAYLLAGIFFGIVLVKSEAVAWFRT